MKTIVKFAAMALVVASPASLPLPAAEPKVEEKIVGPAGAGGLYVVSQNDARIAYVGAKGTRTVVSVDGVEGPVLDELFNGSAAIISGGGPVLVHVANAGGKFNGTPSAVIFSDAGSHFAYIGRQGNDYVVVHDGKEVGRGPRTALSLQHSPLGLSPSGKHAFWGEMKTEGGRGTYRLIMNGKAEPWSGHQELKPVFSPDDSRYAYQAANPDDYRKPILIVDGKVAGYVGGNPVFTADNKLITTTEAKNILLEGKRLPIEGISVEKIVAAPVGSRWAAIMRKKVVNAQGIGTLFLDGKEVPGTEGAMDISFSPDAKHYALRCMNPEAKSFFMVIDGKKGTEYQTVADKVYWTPDSTKAIYQISSSGRNFVVVNTEEFPVQMVNSLMRSPFPMAKKGGRYGFSSVDGSNRNFLAIVDGKQVLPAGVSPNGDTLEFSENGARYAFVVAPVGRSEIAGIVDDGQLNTTLAVSSFAKFAATELANPYFVLSPDGKYMARMARTAQNTNAGLYINDKLAYPTTLQVAYPSFTPDSKHLFWLAAERTAGKPGTDYVVYVDGQPTAKFSGEQMINTKGSWRMGADGVLTVAGLTGDSLKRYRITPAADQDIDKMVAQAEEKQARAIADAAAAKKKAEDEKLAAKLKAEADAAAVAAKRKEDADAYAAKRKADYDAKVKARADALEARKKAAADAAAARQQK